MCSKRAAPAMLAFCWQIYICGDKPRARGKCARRSGGTGLKISCWLPRLYAALSFSLSHALCHRALTCFAPQSLLALHVGKLANEGYFFLFFFFSEGIGLSWKWQKQHVLASISGSWRGFSVQRSLKGQVRWNRNACAGDSGQLSYYFQET